MTLHDISQRAQILKKFKIAWNFQSRLEISISLEIFNPDLQNSPQKIGVWWVARLKISSSLENFKILNFFRIWALRVRNNERHFATLCCDILWQFPSLSSLNIKRHKTSWEVLNLRALPRATGASPALRARNPKKVWKKSPRASGPGVPKSLEKVSRKFEKSGKSLENICSGLFWGLFPDYLGPWSRRPWETFFRLFWDVGPGGPERLL